MNQRIMNEAMEQHGQELVNVINRQLEAKDNGQSLLSENQVNPC
ncbi:hypothetical protein [Halobacillus amylolyticus]|nr:hypothetical protein [Halobacillus amylolyticus]